MDRLSLIDVTNEAGAVIAPAWLAAAEPLHRELRPQLPADYTSAMSRVFQTGGRMIVATLEGRAIGLAVWRVLENTVFGRFLYVDDLVTKPDLRSRGVGKSLLARCDAIAAEHQCRTVVLDSGLQRAHAHRFYFREGFAIQAFNFGKAVVSAPARVETTKSL